VTYGAETWTVTYGAETWTVTYGAETWTVTYGAETWTLRNKWKNVNDMGKKDIEENIWTKKENGHWRIKTNEELMTKYKAPDIVKVIRI
jgi:hypothetical protein